MNRLRQIDDELRALEIRREELIRARERLLAEKGLNETNAVPFSPDKKISLFLSLFRCRGDVYLRLWENPKTGKKGYSPVCRNEWFRGVCEKPRVKCSECPHQAFPPLDEAVAREHLTGKSVIGTYAIREDNSCVFLAADFDGAGWREDVTAYRDSARELGLEVAVERSRSGNGGHAWIFFSEPLQALLARRLGTLIMAKASALRPTMSLGSYDRFFPNQDRLPEGGFGNLIALPLQAKAREAGNSAFLDDAFVPHEDQWSFLAKVPKVSPEEIEAIMEKASPPVDDADLRRFEDHVLDLIPAKIRKGDFTGTLQCLRRGQVVIPTKDLPLSIVAALKRLGTLANPVFFEKQRLRFGTWNIPRFIFCGEMHDDRIVLPRGSFEDIGNLVRKAGGELEIEDQRITGAECDLGFQGELQPAQRFAVEAILHHEEGVLIAPPGAGKTVMGCAVIAARKTPTLILVHRKPLVEQWRARLGLFLGLENKRIGMLSADGGACDAEVVIGMIQTLAKAQSPGTLLARFAQVIIDECHHVPAASFEAVMKACAARYVLGLTATPNRKDGLQKILFLQCGPVRHRMETEANPGIERVLVLRDVPLGLASDDMRMPIHELWELLAKHELRNRMITSDIAMCLAEERNCIALSDRKEHLAHLESLLIGRDEKLRDRVYRMDGAMGKKARKALFGHIACRVAEKTGFVLFATSSLVGEGFDMPELDTLFLALPVSFKGRITQYAGRLHRASEGKSEVRVYDYSEPEHPLTASMLRKRMTAYSGMGYRLADTGEIFS